MLFEPFEDEIIGVEIGLERMLAQQRAAKSVEGGNLATIEMLDQIEQSRSLGRIVGELPNPVAQSGADSAPHFGGGLFGEGDDEEIREMAIALADEPDVALRQGAGLSRTSPRGDRDVALRIFGEILFERRVSFAFG